MPQFVAWRSSSRASSLVCSSGSRRLQSWRSRCASRGTSSARLMRSTKRLWNGFVTAVAQVRQALGRLRPVSYTHLRAHETGAYL
eukprot:7947141-Pyramimonas_sp.AAC.1